MANISNTAATPKTITIAIVESSSLLEVDDGGGDESREIGAINGAAGGGRTGEGN
jgi:hypothetical protein